MQANLPFDHDPDDFRLPKARSNAELRSMYSQDYERWYTRTLAIARSRFNRRLRVWIDPEDINQNVWVAAWIHYERIHGFPEGHRWGWLVVTTQRKVIDAQRLVQRMQAGVERPRALETENGDLNLDALPHPRSRTPLAVASGRELRGEVDGRLHSLPPIEQRVIQLRFFDGFGWAAISRHLGRPISSCESIFRRSWRRFRSMFPSGIQLDLIESLREDQLN